MSRVVYIYALCDPRNDAVRYVGKTVNMRNRWTSHKWAHCRGERRRAWIGELLAEGLIPKMRQLEATGEQHWPSRERFWIAKLRKEGADLLNVRDGGEVTAPLPSEWHTNHSVAMKGHEVTETTRQRISQALKGHSVSAEVRQRVGLSAKLRWTNMPEEEKEAFRNKFRGRKQTPEEKVKQIAAQTGRPKSVETRRKLSEAHKGRSPAETTLKAAAECNRQRWATGVYPTPAQVRQRAEFIAKRPDRTGTKFTEEQRVRLRASQQARRQREAECRLVP